MSEQIEPGPEWRLLGPDEVVSEGDEIAFIGGWAPAIAFGACVGRYGKYRRRIPSKPEKLDINNAFQVEIGDVPTLFVIIQPGRPFAGDVVIGNAIEARQLADWLNRYADWREAQQGESK